MKATLKDGTVLEGTPEELLALGVGEGPKTESIPGIVVSAKCNCVEHAGWVWWKCPEHGYRIGVARPSFAGVYVWPPVCTCGQSTTGFFLCPLHPWQPYITWNAEGQHWDGGVRLSNGNNVTPLALDSMPPRWANPSGGFDISASTTVTSH